MVLSEKKLFNTTYKILHYCNVCGIIYPNINDAIECELNHIKLLNKNVHKKEKVNMNPTMRENNYYVVIYDDINDVKKEFYLKAKNIKNASDILKKEYPGYINYYIEKTDKII